MGVRRRYHESKESLAKQPCELGFVQHGRKIHHQRRRSEVVDAGGQSTVARLKYWMFQLGEGTLSIGLAPDRATRHAALRDTRRPVATLPTRIPRFREKRPRAPQSSAAGTVSTCRAAPGFDEENCVVAPPPFRSF
jgi:hypothetical protein